jgi:hypothetical protein
MAFGQKVKNHWELKQGIRAAWHDNLNIGGWMTYNPSGGQAGNPFGAGTRDQNADQGSPYWKTCPWNAIMDLDIYNNLSIDCGVAFAFFSASSGDAQSCLRFERYRLRNNMHHCNPGSVMPGFNSSDPWPIPGLRLGSTQGMVTDVILDHNHFIINGGNPNIQYWNATTQLPAYPRILLTTGSQDPWTTITGDPRNSRFQITNNIFDTQSSTPGFGNNATFYNDPAIGTAGVYSSWTQIPVFVDVWITNNLRTQDNVQFVQTSLWQGPALYGAIGFSNWPGSPAIPPIPVSNWNVTTGTWVTTDTLPIGATLT